MTPQNVALLGLAIIFLVCWVVTALMKSDQASTYKKRERDARAEMTDLREKYISVLDTGNLREGLLKRALQDMAEDKNETAQFVLDVVYGKTAKKS